MVVMEDYLLYHHHTENEVSGGAKNKNARAKKFDIILLLACFRPDGLIGERSIATLSLAHKRIFPGQPYISQTLTAYFHKQLSI
jgi:hypothetical protein